MTATVSSLDRDIAAAELLVLHRQARRLSDLWLARHEQLDRRGFPNGAPIPRERRTSTERGSLQGRIDELRATLESAA